MMLPPVKCLRSGMFALICALGLLPLGASAHEYETDGPVQALLHINPDDDPVARQPSELTFEVTDQTQHFSATDCDCRVKVQSGGKTLLNQAAAPNSADPSLLSAPYTFPKTGTYTVTLIGKPKTAGAFTPFSITFDETKITRQPKTSFPPAMVAVLAVALLVAGGAIYWEFTHDRKGSH